MLVSPHLCWRSATIEFLETKVSSWVVVNKTIRVIKKNFVSIRKIASFDVNIKLKKFY